MSMKNIAVIEEITPLIYTVRGKSVMLDRDLAALYGVETRSLNQAVSRNKERFPEDFMIVLTRDEIAGISQFVTSSTIKFSKNVNAFTEQGVAMLSSVLRSKTAIQVNIQIMRAFTKLRHLVLDSAELRREMEALRADTDGKFRIVFEALDQLLAVDNLPKKKIGFTAKEKLARYGPEM